ncbi:hypothetical protein EV356DRAFT_531718 [Viridothelium virens]|uniref:Uncharacterized protein n=1 Tax=Viridothelium virens TaxID=1048519 RepID=A0A6A6HBQ3_VIRVR|nr:hypothetical protein EV356DRAFT_531718 [Viridothelium virens]
MTSEMIFQLEQAMALLNLNSTPFGGTNAPTPVQNFDPMDIDEVDILAWSLGDLDLKAGEECEDIVMANMAKDNNILTGPTEVGPTEDRSVMIERIEAASYTSPTIRRNRRARAIRTRADL